MRTSLRFFSLPLAFEFLDLPPTFPSAFLMSEFIFPLYTKRLTLTLLPTASRFWRDGGTTPGKTQSQQTDRAHNQQFNQ